MVFDLPTFSIDLYLFYYDSKWIKKEKKKKKKILGKQGDLIMCSGTLMTLLPSMMAGNLRGVIKEICHL